MKYEKAVATVIELNEEDIITASVCTDLESLTWQCTTSGFLAAQACGRTNHEGKYVWCENGGHVYHGGQ